MVGYTAAATTDKSLGISQIVVVRPTLTSFGINGYDWH